MESAAEFKHIGAKTGTQVVAGILGDVEAVARERFYKGRLTVKHNWATGIFEAGNIRFG